MVYPEGTSNPNEYPEDTSHPITERDYSWFPSPAEPAPTCPRCEGLSRRIERLERHRSCLKSFLDAAQSIVGEFDMLLAEEKGTIVRYHHLIELIEKLGNIVADYDIWWFNETENIEKSQEVGDGG